MPVFSCLRAPASAGGRSTLAQVKHLFKKDASVRNMSDNSMAVRSSGHQRERLRDNFVYFTALGAIPLAIFTAYMNIFVGPAELREIPEGYVPEVHEYHKGPVQRFIAKYMLTPPEKMHERSIYYLYKADEMRKNKLLYEKYKKLSVQRHDDKGWFYVPHSGTVEDKEGAVRPGSSSSVI